jgi:hypothetical protein
MATIFTMAPTRSAIEYHADAPRSLWFPPSKVASWSKCPPLPYTRGTVRVHPLRHLFGGTVCSCLKCRRDLRTADFASACPERVFRISDALKLRFHECLKICLEGFLGHPKNWHRCATSTVIVPSARSVQQSWRRGGRTPGRLLSVGRPPLARNHFADFTKPVLRSDGHLWPLSWCVFRVRGPAPSFASIPVVVCRMRMAARLEPSVLLRSAG